MHQSRQDLFRQSTLLKPASMQIWSRVNCGNLFLALNTRPLQVQEVYYKKECTRVMMQIWALIKSACCCGAQTSSTRDVRGAITGFQLVELRSKASRCVGGHFVSIGLLLSCCATVLLLRCCCLLLNARTLCNRVLLSTLRCRTKICRLSCPIFAVLFPR